MDPNVLLSPGLFLCRTQAWHLPWRTGTTFPNTHEYLILLDCIYAKNGNGTRGGEGGSNASKSMTQNRNMRGGKQREWRRTYVSFLLFIPQNNMQVITLLFSSFMWQLWQYKVTSSKYTTWAIWLDRVCLYCICPAPPGTDYINSISLAQPEYQHHRLDFTLPCLPESGPQNNIYTICAFRKMMMVS